MNNTEAISTWKDEQIKRLTEYSNEQGKEIEKLKGLLRKYYCAQWHPDYDENIIEQYWHQFQKENNL